MINWYRALRTIGKPIGNPTIELPVKILWGAQDRFLASEMAELSLGYCPKGQLTLLPEASHWLQSILNAHLAAGAVSGGGVGSGLRRMAGSVSVL